jgi:hypothetical protein
MTDVLFFKPEGQPATFEEAIEALGNRLKDQGKHWVQEESDIGTLRDGLQVLIGVSVRNLFSLWAETSPLYTHMEGRFNIHDSWEMADRIILGYRRQAVPTRYERVLDGTRSP